MTPAGAPAKVRLLAVTDLVQADPVLEHALLAAQALDGEVVLVHALDVEASEVPAAYARAQTACELAAARSPRISRTFVLRCEDPVSLLGVSAREMGATLVVVGGQGNLGSTVRGALRECPCPLWLARGDGPVRRIAGPAGLDLVEQLGRGLQAERIAEDQAGPGDLQVVDTRGLSTLARLDRVQQAWGRVGPLLIWPNRRAALPVGTGC